MRKALILLAAGVAVALAGTWLAFNYLDVVVRVALEHWGPDVLGTKVAVEAVQISPRDGRGRIAGLEIGSPAGFSAPRALRIGEIRLALDPATLWDDVVRVHELEIGAIDITYERGDRAANLEVIQRNIERYAREPASRVNAGEERGAKAKRRYVIDRLALRSARVRMTNPGLRGQGIAFDLPDVELTGVGRGRGGVTASEAAALVSATLQRKIALRVLSNVEALRRGGLGTAIDALKLLIK